MATGRGRQRGRPARREAARDPGRSRADRKCSRRPRPAGRTGVLVLALFVSPLCAVIVGTAATHPASPEYPANSGASPSPTPKVAR